MPLLSAQLTVEETVGSQVTEATIVLPAVFVELKAKATVVLLLPAPKKLLARDCTWAIVPGVEFAAEVDELIEKELELLVSIPA